MKQPNNDEMEKVVDALKELVDIVQGHLDDGDELDSFTLQVANKALDGYLAHAQRDEVDGVSHSTVLQMIRFALTGDMVGFERYARFAGEKSNSEIFTKAIDKYFQGDFGNTVIPMAEGEK